MLRTFNKFIIPLLLIPAVLVIIWFRNGLIHGGGEEGILFYNSQKTFLLSTAIWAEHGTGMLIFGWLPRAPIMYLSVISEQSGTPPVIFQSVLFYILLVTGVLSVHYLTLNLLDQYKGKFQVSLISALFYLFNPFSFSQIWGRSLSTQYYAFALLPLTLLLFYLGIKRRQYIFGLLIALISLLMATAYEFLTFIIVYWLILLIYFIYRVAISNDRTKEVFFGIKFILFIFILWYFFNSWWFVPLFLSFGSVNPESLPGGEQNLGSLLGVSRNFTPEVIVRLLHKGYFFDATAYSHIYATLPFQLISLLPPFFVLVGLVKTLRSQELVKFRFFVVLLILGFVVSSGANPPLGWLFVWVFEHITPLQAFRNPFEKFGLVYALGYSVIFAYGLASFLERWKFKYPGILTVLILTCGVYAWPMWTGRVIAGYDKKIGLDIPTYYKELRNWLKDRGGDYNASLQERSDVIASDYRLLMTPIWGGDSAFYQWNDAARYQGSDPMVFMLDQPVISNSARGPYYYDFITNVRKYMERIDLAPSLSLLRAKFLVDRKDAILITDREKDQYKFLTSVIYPPKGVESNLKTICENKVTNAELNNVAWIVCQIPQDDGDLRDIKYLHVKVKTDVQANVEVAIRDNKDTRIRWDGRADSDYSTDTNDWRYITIPLSAPTEYNSAIDLSKVFILEVLAHPKDNPLTSVGEIKLGGIKLDPGTQQEINEFRKVAEFGNLSVFEPINFNPPPEFGSLSSIDKVKDFAQLFEVVNKKRDQIDKKGFVLVSQNNQRNLQDLPDETYLQVTDKYKISDTRYWLKVNGAKVPGLLLLSKTFNPQWKVIAGVSREKLSGNFFDDLNLLKAVVLPEDNHFVVNGYANLWRIDVKDSDYAVVFMPQIIADVSSKVSIFSVVMMVGFTTTWGIWRLIKKN